MAVGGAHSQSPRFFFSLALGHCISSQPVPLWPHPVQTEPSPRLWYF
jgi:hypothetical protein